VTSLVRWWSWYAKVYDLLWAGVLTDALAASVVQHAGTPTGPTVDIGCGTGLVSRHLVHSGHFVIVIDSSMAMLRRLHRRLPSTQAVLGSVDHPPVRRGAASVVVATNVLHLHPEPGRAVGQLSQLLSPAGKLICSWPRDDAGPRRIGSAERRSGLGAAAILARLAGRVAVGLTAPTSAHRSPVDRVRTDVTVQARRLGLQLDWFDLPVAQQTLAVLTKPPVPPRKGIPMSSSTIGRFVCIDPACDVAGLATTRPTCVKCGAATHAMDEPGLVIPTPRTPPPSLTPKVKAGMEVGSRVFYGGFWVLVTAVFGIGGLAMLGDGNAGGLLGLIIAALAGIYAVYIFRGGRFRIMFW
jgi:SAM-dependent methyltransferase